jgi:hypothetical protein
MYSNGLRSASTLGRLPKTRTFSLPFFSPKKGSREFHSPRRVAHPSGCTEVQCKNTVHGVFVRAKRLKTELLEQKEQPQKSGLRYNATRHGSAGSPHRSVTNFGQRPSYFRPPSIHSFNCAKLIPVIFRVRSSPKPRAIISSALLR